MATRKRSITAITPDPPTVTPAQSGPSNLMIVDSSSRMVVSINMTNGQVTYGESFNADSASKEFYEAVGRHFLQGRQ